MRARRKIKKCWESEQTSMAGYMLLYVGKREKIGQEISQTSLRERAREKASEREREA
jgi:hypothetical protein